MSTKSDLPAPSPLPLPASAVPDGCPPWDGAQARRWTEALPPGWVPLWAMVPHVLVAVVAGAAVTWALTGYADWHPWAAALLGLHAVLLLVRPELIRVSVPALGIALLVQRPALPWTQSLLVVLALALAWTAAELRLAARAGQRRAASAAAGEATAVLPDAGRPVKRGTFLAGFGGVVTVVGAVLIVTHPGDGRTGAAIGWLPVGLGLVALLSGLLGHRRATALRRAPAPVLRVLVREGADGDTEVFAADDMAALRPLFTVSVTEPDDENDDEDDEEGDRHDKADDEAKLAALVARIERDGPGPLREAVLYGTPCDGAEILLVTAAEEPDAPPVVERSSGPVRPLPQGTLRRRLAAEKRKADQEAAYAERGRAAAEAVAGQPGGPVRRWHAGWIDRLVALALVTSGTVQVWGDTWRYGAGTVLGLVGAVLLPQMAAWNVTADSEGLWFNGFRRTGHIPWDQIRVVRCKGTQLKIDSKRVTVPEWSVSTLRWPWLERRFGLLHPYERTAAEIAGMWRDPARRPTDASRAGQRGRRPLWPLGVLLAVAWTAVLILLP